MWRGDLKLKIAEHPVSTVSAPIRPLLATRMRQKLSHRNKHNDYTNCNRLRDANYLLDRVDKAMLPCVGHWDDVINGWISYSYQSSAHKFKKYREPIKTGALKLKASPDFIRAIIHVGTSRHFVTHSFAKCRGKFEMKTNWVSSFGVELISNKLFRPEAYVQV